MNKTEFVGIVRKVVREELVELLKSKEGRVMMREMVNKTVRIEVDRLLTEMESSQEEVIQERKDNPKLSRMVARGELPATKQQEQKREIPKVAFVKNQKLNALLQDTFEQVAAGKAQLPSQLDGGGAAGILREQYSNMADEWKTIPGNFTSQGAQTFGHARPVPQGPEDSGKSPAQMLPDKDVNGNPLMVNPNALPDHISKALTRDYRKLMKKVEEKRG